MERVIREIGHRHCLALGALDYGAPFRNLYSKLRLARFETAPDDDGRLQPVLAVFAVFCSEISAIASRRSVAQRRLIGAYSSDMRREHYGNFSVAFGATRMPADLPAGLVAKKEAGAALAGWLALCRADSA
jgi:hypothetical protein